MSLKDEQFRGNGEQVLLVEDDPSGRKVGAYMLQQANYRVEAVASAEEALSSFSSERHRVVVTDVKMGGMSGLDLLRQLKSRSPEVPVVVVTAFGDMQMAVEAMKSGAADFIGKPFNRDHLLLTLRRVLDGQEMVRELRRLRIKAAGVERPIIYRSAAMESLISMTDRVAASDATVLVVGESGTGKELVARRIHVNSTRAEGPFVAINCAAMPPELLESELFGHEKGAFTGAARSRKGKFRQAQGGTLFLDEVAEMAPQLQGKLLRVLQEKVVDVVGADSSVPVDVRVVAATNRDMRKSLESGAFREDLYYRLGVVELRVPPLAERREDIEPLVRHFVGAAAEGRDLAIPVPLMEELRRRPWPGNVRELQNVCERLVILCDGDALSVADLPTHPGHSHRPSPMVGEGVDLDAPPFSRDDWPPLPPDGFSLVDMEKRIIERVLQAKRGNITQAARYLRVPRHILAYRMEKYGIAKS